MSIVASSLTRAMMKQTVAVVGAGPSGLSMLKQLREDGFSVTGFERRGKVGGLWAYSEDPSHTTALPSEKLHHLLPPCTEFITDSPFIGTTALLSKYTCGFSDYPMPEKYPIFFKSDQFQEYMED
ncbi:hypothetical protein N0V93_009522 [Gnomoniopsis smithogilvyi]|uniref:Flavin-containing monooxygenase n=1 Tax=Gnomoniopsis smithogilvyi TaxID=1191159 RepID=A0A9W9CTW0_9PEZI|nr:hypothetical protein N0V93_009522 [Gnomoniopsis smithogilvyi]